MANLGPWKAAILALALPAVLLVVSACGDDGDSGPTAEPTLTGDGAGSEDATNGEPVTFTISMQDNSFDTTKFEVPGRSTAIFTLPNGGTAIHNMRIAGADGEYNTTDDAVSEPPLVNGGETATLEWVTPGRGGSFDFRCDFHPAEMVGTITVAAAAESPDSAQEDF